MNLTKQFFKYVSQNIFGLLGTSCYILADTYFISQAAGTDGVTLLNLCLPIYNFIFAIGSMIGLGAATRYAILRAQGEERAAQRYFSNAVFCACLLAVPFVLVGIFCPGTLLRLMGGDAGIVALGIPYARIFLLFTPFFMCNYIVSAFVRNDGAPSLAMVATLSGSLFNVVFDYIFMFPMGLGLAGAALATAVSPMLSIAICSRHFFQKDNTVQFVRQLPSAKLLGQSCQLGISRRVGKRDCIRYRVKLCRRVLCCLLLRGFLKIRVLRPFADTPGGLLCFVYFYKPVAGHFLRDFITGL